MIPGKLTLVLLTAVAAALCACSAPSRLSQAGTAPGGDHVDLQSLYAGMGQAGGRVFGLEPGDSAVRIYAFRAGPAAKLGHNHVLSAPQFAGFFYLAPGGAADGRFDLEFRLDQLEIDNPTERSKVGGAFSSALDPNDIASTREHLLGADGLQAERFPFVLIHSLQISGDGPQLAVKVQVEMHGQAQEMWIPLEVDGLPERLSVRGSFVLHQTDFGVQPYSVVGGLLSVLDEVVVDFKLTGVCRPEISSHC